MSTALAAQLQQLAAQRGGVAPSGAPVGPGASRGLGAAPSPGGSGPPAAASFLYEPREAAAMSMESVFEQGVGGLMQLCAIDGRFEPFHQTLFGLAAKKYAREVMSADENGRLDKSVATFLRLLGPHLLLRAAHKALEFLVRRYRIHVHSAHGLLRAFLPYHATPLFARAVRIAHLGAPDGGHGSGALGGARAWQWLAPVKASGLPLPRDALVARCASHPETLGCACELAAELVAAAPATPAGARARAARGRVRGGAGGRDARRRRGERHARRRRAPRLRAAARAAAAVRALPGLAGRRR